MWQKRKYEIYLYVQILDDEADRYCACGTQEEDVRREHVVVVVDSVAHTKKRNEQYEHLSCENTTENLFVENRDGEHG